MRNLTLITASNPCGTSSVTYRLNIWMVLPEGVLPSLSQSCFSSQDLSLLRKYFWTLLILEEAYYTIFWKC